MGAKSTRTRIMYHLLRAATELDRVVESLKNADDRSAGRHPLIEEHVPTMIAAISELQGALRALREQI